MIKFKCTVCAQALNKPIFYYIYVIACVLRKNVLIDVKKCVIFKSHSTRCADNVKKRCDLECGARVCLLKTIASSDESSLQFRIMIELQSYDFDEKPKLSIALWSHADTKINVTENWIRTVLFRVNARQAHLGFMVRFHYDTVSMQGIITNACFFDLLTVDRDSKVGR